MRLDFCTSLALNGVPKLAALLYSINKHVRNEYRVWVLCEGEDTENAVKNLKFSNVTTLLLEKFEIADQGLLNVKSERDAFEYNCTLRPSWMLYVLDHDPNIDFLTYLDNDLFFFNDPAVLYDGFNDASVLISPHRISRLARLTGVDVNIVGKFNAGWLAVRNDEEARKVLSWWRLKCLEWCARIPEDGKFGEQKYLDYFQTVSKSVAIVQHLGANVAPWNMNGLQFGCDADDVVKVDGHPLIFFHFHALKAPGESSFKVDREVGKKLYQLTNPNYVVTKDIKSFIYAPYLSVLNKFICRSESINDNDLLNNFDVSLIDHLRQYRRLIIEIKSRLIFMLISALDILKRSWKAGA
jgi:hypothetical protein